MTERVEKWRSRLLEYLTEAEAKEPSYGQNDCALFAANAVLVMTGVDFAEEFRGKYSTEIGAAKALKQAGYDDLEALAQDKFEEVPIFKAQTGDLALVRGVDGKPAMGIVAGPFIRTAYGLTPLEEATRTFTI